MQIAQHIMPNGMSAKAEFCFAITELIKTYKLKNIVETGTYMGEGTTKAIADAMLGDEIVYSIEVNPRYYEIARKKHKNTTINFLLGLSVSRPLLPTDFTWDVPPNIVIDHLDHNREILYKQEVSFNVPDNMLEYALSKMDYQPDLVILDSAGHMGLVEFKQLMKLAQAPFFLALDDTNHIKHYESVKLLDAMDVNLLFETEEGFGSRIYYIK
jgi:cephalosporin hydroxylase